MPQRGKPIGISWAHREQAQSTATWLSLDHLQLPSDKSLNQKKR
jgi:hypothetical protein